MERAPNLKPALKKIVIFGSNSRIGKPVVKYITEKSPDTALRLVVRKTKRIAPLQAEFPNAEIVLADYYDLPSLEKALRGADGAFIVTPDFLDEERGMTNVIYAARRSHSMVHIVRLLGDPPGMTLDRVPDIMKRFGGGTTIQHMKAKKVLRGSDLPITYLNCASYFMQNFTDYLFGNPLKELRTLVCPRNRRMGFIDCNDIGRCAGALLLSTNHRHIGQTYHLDNGNDVMMFSDVAELMSEVWGEKITYEGTDEGYRKIMGPAFSKTTLRADTVEFFLGFSQFEQDNETIWRKSDIVEYLTGEKAKTLRQWLQENKKNILG